MSESRLRHMAEVALARFSEARGAVLVVREVEDGLGVGQPGDVLAQPVDGSAAYVVTPEMVGISAGLMTLAMRAPGNAWKIMFPNSYTRDDIASALDVPGLEHGVVRTVREA
jgi:hypothetical protein